MARSGLSKRLQQQSRRSGFAVGLSMVLAIGICFAAFTWIYVQLEPWVQDFAGAEEAPATRTPRPEVATESENEPDAGGGDAEPTETPEARDSPDEEPTIEEQPTEEPEAFDSDYVVSAGTEVNFRTEGSSAGGGATIIFTIPDGTRLEATGETAPADSPDNGPWREFRLEDGTQGWLRDVDVSET